MGDRTYNPFVLRHPISLGDAIAALFRPKPKRQPFAKNFSGNRPEYQRAESPDPESQATDLDENSSPAPVASASFLR
ncbi:MAG TPA: hypothetical protein VGL22_13035 [Terracidiphilus sp.]